MFSPHGRNSAGMKRSINDRDVDTGFFKDVTVLEDTRGTPTAVVGAVPRVPAEFGTVDFLQGGNDFGLFCADEGFDAEAHGGVGREGRGSFEFSIELGGGNIGVQGGGGGFALLRRLELALNWKVRCGGFGAWGRGDGRE